MKTTVYFYPKHKPYSLEEHDKAIAEYRVWLDQHGDYGRLYMMHIGKVPKEFLTEDDLIALGDAPRQSQMIGFDIYDGPVAMLFRLTFSL
jgi:hypothetical protein